MTNCHDLYEWAGARATDTGRTACHDTYAAASTESSPELSPLRRPIRTVVVGVDGSANSITALRRAAREATQAQAALKVVFAYHPRPFGYPIRPPRVEPESGDELAGFGPVHGRRASEDEDEAMQVLRQCVEEAFGDRRPARMQLVAKVGVAHKLLTELAGKGDLLVVGARGHSGTLRFLLGSTAAACANNARCPVLVVPADSAEAAKASRQAAVS